jgi:hypothetical protein
MQTQQAIEGLIHSLYRKVGGDPQDIDHVIPVDGDWGNAIAYHVIRSDGAVAAVFQDCIDAGNEGAIEEALCHFEPIHP